MIDLRFPLRPRDYVHLYKVSKIRNQSSSNYFAFQKYQGSLLIRLFKSRGIDLTGKRLLDLGSGPGGYSAAFADSGANVFCVDLTANPDYKGVPSVSADALQLPFDNGQFDIIVCASLIEHVAEPEKLLAEIIRVLAEDGIVYLSFPPFYSPNGGHQFAPFHLLGEKVGIRLARRFGMLRNEKKPLETVNYQSDSFQKAFGEWGLYVLTIRKASRLLKEKPVKVLERSTRWMPVDFSWVPWLGELMTWHVQFFFKKK